MSNLFDRAGKFQKQHYQGANLRSTGLQSATLPLRHIFLSTLYTITLALAHTNKKMPASCASSVEMLTHGVRWSNHTYVSPSPAQFSLLATCVVFWSHRRRDIVYTAVMFSPERMYITLDSSACTSYLSLKMHKCIWRFVKVTGLHELSSFLLSQ